MRHCCAWGFIVLTSLSGSLISSPTRAESGVPPREEAGVDSGSTDASVDASGAGGTGGSTADARAGSGGTGAAGPSDSGNDGPRVEAAVPKGDASHALVGTSAIACGPPAGTLNPELLPSCVDVCPFGSCVPASQVPTQAAGLPNCSNPTDKCMPRFLIETLGNVRFKSCRSVGSVEGRCLPSCLPIVSGEPLPLPQDDCLASERCVPCFNPLDGRDNGVCNYQCDPGPQREPVIFPGCCGSDGVCLSTDLLPVQDRPRLRRESCGANSLCAPKDPSSQSFPCEVRESGPPPGTGGSGGGNGNASGGVKSARDAGKNAAAAQASDDGGCGCRVATNNHENIAPWICFLGAAALARRRRVIR
jgi:hypothetical protein